MYIAARQQEDANESCVKDIVMDSGCLAVGYEQWNRIGLKSGYFQETIKFVLKNVAIFEFMIHSLITSQFIIKHLKYILKVNVF